MHSVLTRGQLPIIAMMADPLRGFEFRRTETGLWVTEGERSADPHALGLVVAQPQHIGPTLILPSRPAEPEGLFAYATEDALGLDTFGREAIIEWLALMPSEFTFVNLAVLLRQLATMRTDAAAHLRLAREIYHDAPVVDAMGRFCAEDHHVVFSEQALFALLCQAVIHSRPETRQSFTEHEGLALKRLILAAPGLLHEGAEIGEYNREEPEEWLVYLTQNLLFNANQNFGHGLARTWKIFGELATDSDEAKASPVDYPALVAATGLDVAQQLALAFGLYAKLGMDAGPVALLPEYWEDMCRRVAPNVSPQALIAGVAATPAEMRAELTSEEARQLDPNLRWASVAFIERPFLRLEDGRILLVSPKAIEGWATHGVYYRLLSAAIAMDPDKGAQNFTSLVGDLTEVYTLDLLERAHEDASGRSLGVGQVVRAQSLGEGTESIDAFIVEGGDVVLIEISSSRITAPTRLGGDPVALRRDLLKLAVKRVKQLHRTAEALLADGIPGLPPRAEINRIFPVIVNVEPLHWSPQLHAYLIREVPGLLQQPGMQALQFVEIEDLEWLMSMLGPWSLARLLALKLESVGTDPDIQQWLHSSPLAPHATRPKGVAENMDRMFETMTKHLGLSGSEIEGWRQERAWSRDPARSK